MCSWITFAETLPCPVLCVYVCVYALVCVCVYISNEFVFREHKCICRWDDPIFHLLLCWTKDINQKNFWPDSSLIFFCHLHLVHIYKLVPCGCNILLFTIFCFHSVPGYHRSLFPLPWELESVIKLSHPSRYMYISTFCLNNIHRNEYK